MVSGDASVAVPQKTIEKAVLVTTTTEDYLDVDRRARAECLELRRRFEANEVSRKVEIERLLHEKRCERGEDMRRRVCIALHLAKTARFSTLEESLTNFFVACESKERVEFVARLVEHPMPKDEMRGLFARLIRNLNNPLTLAALSWEVRGLRTGMEAVMSSALTAGGGGWNNNNNSKFGGEEEQEEAALKVLCIYMRRRRRRSEVPWTRTETETEVYKTLVFPFLESRPDLHYRFLSRLFFSSSNRTEGEDDDDDDGDQPRFPPVQGLYSSTPAPSPFLESSLVRIITEAYKSPPTQRTRRINALIANVVEPHWYFHGETAESESPEGKEERRRAGEKEFIGALNKFFIQSRSPIEVAMLIAAFHAALENDSPLVARCKSRALQSLPGNLKDMKMRIDYSNAVRSKQLASDEGREEAEKREVKRAKVVVEAKEDEDDEMVKPMIARLCEILASMMMNTAGSSVSNEREEEEEEVRKTVRAVVALSGVDALVSSSSLCDALASYLIGVPERRSEAVRRCIPKELAMEMLRKELRGDDGSRIPTTVTRLLSLVMVPSLSSVEAMHTMAVASSASLRASLAVGKALVEMTASSTARKEEESRSPTCVKREDRWYYLRWIRERVEVMAGSRLEEGGDAKAMDFIDLVDGMPPPFLYSTETTGLEAFLESELLLACVEGENEGGRSRRRIRRQTWLTRILGERYGMRDGRNGEGIARRIAMLVLRGSYSYSSHSRRGDCVCELDVSLAINLMTSCREAASSTSRNSHEWFLLTWEEFLVEEENKHQQQSNGGASSALSLLSRAIEEELFPLVSGVEISSLEWRRRLRLL